MPEMPENISDKVSEDRLLLGAIDCAAMFGCTVRTWRSWNTAGFTPEPVRIGGSVFWRPKELVAWVDAGCPKRELWQKMCEDS